MVPLKISPIFSLKTGSSVLGTEDDLAVSLRFMNFGASPPSSDEGPLDAGLSSFVENPQYFCGIIKDKDMCKGHSPESIIIKSTTCLHTKGISHYNDPLHHPLQCVQTPPLMLLCALHSLHRRTAYKAKGHRAEMGARRGGFRKSLPG